MTIETPIGAYIIVGLIWGATILCAYSKGRVDEMRKRWDDQVKHNQEVDDLLQRMREKS